MKHSAAALLVLMTLAPSACRTAPPESAVPVANGPVQTETDEYTRYELLGADSHKFRISHDVSATTPGARYYFALVRGGVFLSDVRAQDLYSGERLDVDLVSGKVARENGHAAADPGDSFLRIHLARPVPEHGETRLSIQVTYDDAKSYQFDGTRIFFGRVLAVKRLCIVLPADHELVSVNHPAQIVAQPDGRVRISLINTTKSPLALEIVATHCQRTHTKAADATAESGADADFALLAPASFHACPPAHVETGTASRASVLVERAHQDRKVVWTLGDPLSSTFVLQRECTETRGGADRWVDIVSEPRRASKPTAIALDTGEPVTAELLTVPEAMERGLASESDTLDAHQVVAVTFEPLRQGATLRLRIEEEIFDPERYTIANDELAFTAQLTDARSRVVLPKGWFPTESATPASVVETADGRIALDFVNTSPMTLELCVRARTAAQ